MNPMDSNGLTDSLKTMMKGLEGLVSNLEVTVKNSFSNMSAEDAEGFAKAMKEQNVPEKLKDVTENINALKGQMKFD